MVRILTSADVEDLLDLRQAKTVLEETFRQQPTGGVVAWPPSLMHSGGSLLILRSGGLPSQGRMGVRVTTGPHNPSYALISESPSGRLLCFMAYPFSDLRLDASVAVGVDHLAPPDAHRVALIGTGRLALGVLEAVAAVRPVEQVEVFSRRSEQRSAFADRAAERLGLPVTAADDPRAAVSKAEIVVVATNSETPALHGSWLAPGTHVVAIGLRTEVDADVFVRAERIVTTSKVQEMNIHDVSGDWPLVQATRSGRVKWDDVLEIGQVVANNLPKTAGISVFRDAQGGFGDIALATWAYERAVELGRGTDLMVE